ncbi:MAG: peptidylprolyl isomerase [Anaeromyxobacteraceae bacterium]
MRRNVIAGSIIACALALAFALGRASVSPGLLAGEERGGPAIASFRGGALPVAAAAAALKKQPEPFRDQLRTPAAKRAVVEELVRFELLALEGERKGLQRDPKLLRRYKEELGRRLVEAEVDEPQRKASPSDDEVRKFYAANEDALGRPERVRLAVVQWAATPGDPGARAKRARAETALARLKGTPEDAAAFARTARQESEEAGSRLANGELPFLTREELAQRLGKEVADAAFVIPATGQLAPGLVQSAQGLHAVKLLGREEGYRPAFEELKEAIRARLAAERRGVAHDAFVKRIWTEAGVKLDEKAIEALKLD